MSILPHLLTIAALAATGWLGWRFRRLPAITLLLLTVVLCAIWALSEALGLLSYNLPGKLFWLQSTYLAVALAPPAWLALVTMLTSPDYKWARQYLPLLFFVPFVTLLVVLTGRIGSPAQHGELLINQVRLLQVYWDWTRLFNPLLADQATAQAPLVLVLAYHPGPWFWVQQAYSWLLLLGSYFLLGRGLLTSWRSRKTGRASPGLAGEAALDQPPVSQPGELPSQAGPPGAPGQASPGNLSMFVLLLAASLPPTAFLLLELGTQFFRSAQTTRQASHSLTTGQITLYSHGMASTMLLFSAVLAGWMIFRNRRYFSEQLRAMPVARSALVESLHEGVLVLDRQNRLLDFNAKAQYLLSAPLEVKGEKTLPPIVLRRGLDVRSVLADFPDVLHTLGLEEGAAAGSGAALQAGSASSDSNTISLTRRARLSAGAEEDTRHIDLRVSAIFEQNGQVSGRVVVLRDMTKLKRAEDDLRDLKKFNETFMRSMAEGLLVEDAQGLITYINPAGAALLGYQPDELVGHLARNLVASDNLAILERARSHRQPGQVERYELDLVRKDGVLLPVQVASTPLYHQDTHQLTGQATVYLDITGQKRAQQAPGSEAPAKNRLVERLAVLNRMGLAVFAPGESSPGDRTPRNVNAISQVLYRLCQQIGEMDCFYIALYDEDTTTLHIPVFYYRGERGDMQVTSYDDRPLDDPYNDLAAYVIRTQRTLYIADISDPAQLPVLDDKRYQALFPHCQNKRTFLAVPLILGAELPSLGKAASDKRQPPALRTKSSKPLSPIKSPTPPRPAVTVRPAVVGVICMQRYQPGMYSEEQISLLETVALQAAIALESSRLNERFQHELELRTQAEEALRRSNDRLKDQTAEIENLQANLQTTLNRLAEQATRDPLTGLFNRRYLLETLEREIARSARQGLSLSLVMVDVDNLKPLVHTFMREAGDRVLQALGEFLRMQSRTEDIACRFSSEEFVVVLPGAPLEAAFQRAEQWRQSFAKFEFQFASEIESEPSGELLHGTTPGCYHVTLSAGVAAYPDHGTNGNSLLRAAEKALYQAKQAGCNRTCISS